MRRLHHDSTGKPDEDLQKGGGAGPPDARVCAGAHPWDHRAQRLRKDHPIQASPAAVAVRLVFAFHSPSALRADGKPVRPWRK